MPETQDLIEPSQRFALMRACTRRLSGERPPTMREQLDHLARAPIDLDAVGDRYGDGPVALLEERVAALLGKPSAVFFPTGVMAQQVALRIWAERQHNATVALHPRSHPEEHERYAYSTLSGLRAIWSTTAARQPTAEEIRALDEPFGTLMLELPVRELGFLLPTWGELVAVTDAARRRGARVHIDGARLWESTPYLGQDLAAVSALADTVYVSFYKLLGGLHGAALAGDADVMAQARAWRQRYGGNLFQQWPAAALALAGLETVLPQIPSYVEHARVVAAALAQIPGARIHPDPPHTNEFQLWLPYPAQRLTAATLALAQREGSWFAYGWSDRPPTGYAVAEIRVSSGAAELTADDVQAMAASLLALVEESYSGVESFG
jgi:threonine aldolase